MSTALDPDHDPARTTMRGATPSAQSSRPRRHSRPQPWLDRYELTDLVAAAEDEGGYGYALICLLGLNGVRVSEACRPDVGDPGGARYQPTLRIVGTGDKPAEMPLTHAPTMRPTRRSAAAPMDPAGSIIQQPTHVLGVTRQ